MRGIHTKNFSVYGSAERAVNVNGSIQHSAFSTQQSALGIWSGELLIRDMFFVLLQLRE